jgi:RNA polymerase primary sigma factor
MREGASTQELLLQYGQLQQQGRTDEATQVRNAVVEQNLKLVNNMMRRVGLPDVDRADAEQEGRCALIRAVEKFDPGRGFKFSTYASRAIYHALLHLRTRTYKRHERIRTNMDGVLDQTIAAADREDTPVSKQAKALRDILEGGGAGLTTEEAAVIRERFGFEGCGDRRGRWHRQPCLREIGEDMGLSYERVRQLQEAALMKLAAAVRSKP